MRSAAIGMALLVAACSPVTLGERDLSEEDLQQFFVQHRVGGNVVAALKERSLGAVSYLATIHGYPNNLSVCEDLIAPYNKNQGASTVAGEYFCEELR